MKTHSSTSWPAWIFVSAIVACGSAGVDEEGALGGSGGNFGTGAVSTGGGGVVVPPTAGSGGSSAGTGGVPPEPEVEIESTYEAPVATDRFVWAANPETGRVALINAETFDVRLAEAGLSPTVVAAVPRAEDGTDAALVLNTGSEDATLLEINGAGELTRAMVDTHAGANTVAVTPSGRFAIVWTDAAVAGEALDPTDSAQDITVVNLSGELEGTQLSVGFRPSRVVFDEAEERAFVVTEPGLSVIELGASPRVGGHVELTASPADANARDVSVTPDGEIALVRLDGSTSLGVVSIASGEREEVELGNFVTDLDLSSDGRRAFAVVGDELVVIPVPVAGADPSTFTRARVTDVVIRSVALSPDATLALLYSNASPSPYLTVLSASEDFADAVGRSLDLKAPVQAVFAAPDARHAIALQATAPGSRKRGAFSLVTAQMDRAPKIVGTDAAPMAVAFSPDGAEAVIATRDLTQKLYGAYLIHLENLEENFLPLASPPLAAGMVPRAGRAFVAQAHPEGRITFLDLADGSSRTLTGFELAAQIVE
jgi:hypothetical protein